MTDSKKKILQFMTDWMPITNVLELSENIPELDWLTIWGDTIFLELENKISFSPNREWISLNR